MMKEGSVAHGTDRTALMLGAFPDVVFKFANIRPWTGCKILFKALKFRYIFDRTFWSKDVRNSYLKTVVGGIGENWRERSFYRKHPFEFLQPTYFSLLGLVNVQRKGTLMPEDEFNKNVWRKMLFETDFAVQHDDHAFSGESNFSRSGGRLHMHDYASKASQEVILKHADTIGDVLNSA